MINKEKNFISAVIYANNNESDIKEFINVIGKELDDHFNNFEIIVVDDGSTDSTVKKIKEIKYYPVALIELSYSEGLEAAMSAGVDLAIGDFVYEFDKVFVNYDSSLILDLYNKSLTGFDIVSAVDKNNKTSSSIFYSIVNKSSNIQNKIYTETFRILSRRAINRVKSMSSSIVYRKASYANSGLAITSIIYTPINNKKYKDKNTLYNAGLAIDSILLFTNAGYKGTLCISLIMMVLSIVEIVYALVDYVNGVPIEGYTSTVLILTIGLFVIFGMFAMVIKCLSLILNFSYKKNQYTIKNVYKVNRNEESHD